jgi:hypothetical protein
MALQVRADAVAGDDKDEVTGRQRMRHGVDEADLVELWDNGGCMLKERIATRAAKLGPDLRTEIGVAPLPQ